MAQSKGGAVQVFLVLLLAIAIRVLSIDQGVGSLENDEFYHLLAAEGWLRDGSFRIADGYYPRAGAFTWLVAQFMALAPDNILMARLPAIIAGGLLVASVFIWTRRFGNGAAWTAALLLCFADVAVGSSQIVRFYSLHAFAFWVGSISIYAACCVGPRLRRIAWACAAAVALALALHLQVTTLIGIAALAIWVVLTWVIDAPKERRWKRAAVALLLAAAIPLIIWLSRDVSTIAQLLAKYRWTATFAAGQRNDWLFYYHNFALRFGSLLYLFPLAALVAVGRMPRPALFCLTIFTVSLMLQSGGGMKSMQYIPYVLPYFVILWGLAAPPLVAAIRGQASRMAIQLRLPRFAESTLTWVVIGTALAGSPTFFRTARAVTNVLSGTAHDTLTESSAWVAALPELRQLTADASVFLTRDDTRALYFLGGYDLMLNRTRRDDYAPGRDFAIDPRTGGGAIATVASMRLVIDCYPSGLIVVPRYEWRNPRSVTEDVADLIEMLATPVPLQSIHFFRVYRWQHDIQPGLVGCAGVYRVAGDPGHVPFTVRR